MAATSSAQPFPDSIEMKTPATFTMKGEKSDNDALSSSSVEWEGHSDHDRRDMERLGKKQEFKRNFGFWSALGFVGMFNERSCEILRLES